MYTRISLCVCAHGVKSETSLDTGVCVKQSSPATHFLCSTARIRKDISAAWYFCSCKFLWRNDECVLLPCFNAQPDIFAVMNCCFVALSVFSSDILTCSADSLYSVQWRIHLGECVETNMHIISTNFAKTLVWKQEYDVKFWRHKQCAPNTNDHQMPLNETPPMKIFCVRHCFRNRVDDRSPLKFVVCCIC